MGQLGGYGAWYRCVLGIVSRDTNSSEHPSRMGGYET